MQIGNLLRIQDHIFVQLNEISDGVLTIATKFSALKSLVKTKLIAPLPCGTKFDLKLAKVLVCKSIAFPEAHSAKVLKPSKLSSGSPEKVLANSLDSN